MQAQSQSQSHAPALSIWVADLQYHISFLEAVHDAELNQGSALYLDRALLRAAVSRYERLWLPLVASHAGPHHLIPPIDVAWVWHLHRLAPLKYAEYCNSRFGAILDPGSAAFRLETHDSLSCERSTASKEAWERKYPTEPFFLGPGGVPGAATDEPEPALFKPLFATSLRQRTFLWQVSGKSFSCERFLAESIERYDKFLRLMGVCGYDKHFFVPPYDVDLCWHTHSEFLQDKLASSDLCSSRGRLIIFVDVPPAFQCWLLARSI